MDDAWGGLIILGLIIGAIYVIVVYVIPILLGLAAIILAVFSGIGILIGLYYSVRNFAVSINDVRNQRNHLGRFKRKDIQDRVHNEAPNALCQVGSGPFCIMKKFAILLKK